MAAPVEICGLTRRFPRSDRPALAELDLGVAEGEVVCLVGPSGCGKSTTLRLVAGLDEPDAGTIRIGDRDVAKVPPQERDVAMVFQGFALYPHMRVRDILAFPLKMRKVNVSEREAAVKRTAELLSITRLLERRPAELSGGEQQRVAMGRAIVRRPQVFLFDEPLSNLDAALRAELRIELAKLLRQLEATALYVTHDQAEAMTLGNRIAVLRAGKLEQLDTPRRVYESPASTFVAGFFGNPPMNLLQVSQSGQAVILADVKLGVPDHAPRELTLGIRPEHLSIGDESVSGDFVLHGIITSLEPHGAETHVELQCGGQLLRARVPGFDAPAIGSRVSAAFRPGDLHYFNTETGRAL